MSHTRTTHAPEGGTEDAMTANQRQGASGLEGAKDLRDAPRVRQTLRCLAEAVSLERPAYPPTWPRLRIWNRIRLAAVAVLGLAALMSAAPVQAQSVTTLVSNFGQGRDSDTFSAGVRAQTFKTGWNATGFTLHSVDIRVEVGETILGNANSRFSMYVCPVTAEGYPPVRPAEIPSHTACVALTPPTSVAAPATLTFTAPANTHLQRGTHYTVVNIATVGTPLYDATLSDGEDGSGSTSWAIGNGYVWYNSHPRIRRYLRTGERICYGCYRPTTQITGLDQALRIRINGAAASSQVEAPAIAGVPALSEAGPDGAWTADETVEVTLTFSEAVTVDTTDGTPSIGLDLGGTESRRATYLRGSGTTALVFGYTLTDADGSHNSLLVPIDSLALNGGTIRSQATGADVALEHSGAAKIGSTSNGVRDEGDTPNVENTFTASFSALPQTHNGSDAFTFELHFSEAPEGLSYTTVAGGLLAVTGATVTKARRLTAGSNLGWEVTVTPSQSGDIAIRLPARACTETNAVCVGGSPLASAATATVRGVPFTASFSRVPAEHDGAAAFDIRFHLSAEPAGLSYRTVHNGLFDVTGGSIEKASRLVRGKNNGWSVRIDPSGLGDVTVRVRGTSACDTAPGVCTADGRKLAGGLQAVIAGPAALSVADAEVQEGADATLDFTVTLSKQRFTATTVDYATSNGTATAGSDYTLTSGTLTFGPLEKSKTVSVPVLDDAVDEGSETMSLTLSNPSPSSVRLADARAIGTITNSDPLQKMWLSRFGRTVAGHVVEAVSGRLSDPLSGAQVTVGGQSVELSRADGEGTVAQALTGLARALGAGSGPAPEADEGPGAWRDRRDGAWDDPAGAGSARRVTGRELLLGSAFHVASGGGKAGGPGFAAWGRVTTGGFDGEDEADDGAVRMDGEVTTGILGADAAWGRWLAGVAVSLSEGEGSYSYSEVGRGRIESSLTSVNPYARLDVTERVSTWVLLGYGTGEMTMTEAATESRPREVTKTDIEMRLGALGARGALLRPDEAGGLDVAVRADAFLARTEWEKVSNEGDTQADASRLRVILEGSRAFALGEGSVLKPGLELGLRHDGGDAETGTGVEVGGSVRYADAASGLSVEVSARTLLAHEDSGYEEWGASASVQLDPGASGRGLSFTLSPTVGVASSGVERLWSLSDARGVAPDAGAFEASRSLEVRLGYGLGAFGGRGLTTPYVGLLLADGGGSTWRAGVGWSLGPTLNLDLEGTRSETGEETDHAMMLRGTLRW